MEAGNRRCDSELAGRNRNERIKRSIWPDHLEKGSHRADARRSAEVGASSVSERDRRTGQAEQNRTGMTSITSLYSELCLEMSATVASQ